MLRNEDRGKGIVLFMKIFSQNAQKTDIMAIYSYSTSGM